MGRFFKPYYTKKGVFETDADGNVVLKKNGKPKLRKFHSKNFHIEWTDASGRTRHREAGIKEADARVALRKAEGDVLIEKNGLPTQRAGEIKFSELFKTYCEDQRTRVKPLHLVNTKGRIEDLLADCRTVSVRDLTPDAVVSFMNKLSDQGRAPRTVNGYLIAIKALLNWAVKKRRLPYNPLDCVQKLPERLKTRRRRALTEDEIARLLAAAQVGPLRRTTRAYQNRPRKDNTYKPADIPLAVQAKLAREGRNIALCYRLMIEAGLRVNEARTLRWSDIDFENETLHLRAEVTKNSNAAMLPLTPGLKDVLKAWKSETKGKDNDSVVKITDRLLHIFNDDLVAIGLATYDEKDKKKVIKKDASGRTLDLHALRHTFGTRLGGTSNIDPKTVQTLMRHNSPNLTFSVYVHADKNRLRSAMNSLPEVKAAAKVEAPAQAQAIKTGTDDLDQTPDDDPKGGRPKPTSNQQGGKTPREPARENTAAATVCGSGSVEKNARWQSEGHRFDPGILHF